MGDFTKRFFSLITTKSAEVVLQLEHREAVMWASILYLAACFHQIHRNLDREYSLSVKRRFKLAKKENVIGEE